MINITKRGLQHTIKHHTVNQFTRFRHRSKFNENVDLIELINMAASVPFVLQSGNTLSRTFDAGYIVGDERKSGKPTSLVTVITRVNGDLITMYPGTT